MDSHPSTAVVTAVLLSTALALVVLPGTGAAQATQVDDCTTITESGAYTLGPAFGEPNETTTVTETANRSETPTEAGSPTATDTPPEETTEDVPGSRSCLVIAANDVVLDGNGSVLDGDTGVTREIANETEAGPVGTGTPVPVNASQLVGITVRPGPEQAAVSNVTIRDVTVTNWYVGVSLQDASNVTLDNVSLSNNTVGGISFGEAPEPTTPVPTAGETPAATASPTAETPATEADA